MRRACVIGWPVAHSRSPLIHGFWLAQYGIDGTYTKQAVPPEELGTFLKSLGERGFRGCNVTVPHKEAAFRLADETEAAARAIGAVNTLWLEGGRLHGTNTDTYGFMTYLGLRAPGWRQRDAPVSILGAGGAARAIAYGFIDAGIGEVRVFNRTRERGEALAAHLGGRVKVLDWAERSRESCHSSVLVNTTSVGMKGCGSLAMELSKFRPECVVCDIVYVPLETGLIRDAKAAGLATVDGLGMLLHQAVAGFEKWFGTRPDVSPELYQRVAADIEAG